MEINELEDKLNELEESIELSEARVQALVEILKEIANSPRNYEMMKEVLRNRIKHNRGLFYG